MQSTTRPHLSTTMSNTPQTPTAASAGGRVDPSSASPSAGTAPSGSIEQSVRLFKVFEALRSGDTAAVAKAAKEDGENRLEGTTMLHLAIQCAQQPVIDYLLSHPGTDINARDRDGNTPLHIAAMLGREPIVKLLLVHKGANESITNLQGKTALDLARNADIFQELQLARSVYIDGQVRKVHQLVEAGNYEGLEHLLNDSHVRSVLDVNGPELASDPATMEHGGTLLHEAARKRDLKLAQLLLLNGADPFRRDRKGKLPQDVTKDDRTRAILKKSPAAQAAQRNIQERTILGESAQTGAAPSTDGGPGGKEGREMKGYLRKWTNYTSGYKLRWFVLEDGVLSYYKHQDDAGSACRGAINMRIAKLNMDPKDKLQFEIHGKSSVKYSLKANHQVEAKRWFWALNNAIQWAKDEAKEEQKRQQQETLAIRDARNEQMERNKGDGAPTVGGLVPATAVVFRTGDTTPAGGSMMGDQTSTYATSDAGLELNKTISRTNTAVIAGDVDEEEEYGDDASDNELQPMNRDAFSITAQSAKLQLDLLEQISTALQAQGKKQPDLSVSDPVVLQALASYDIAVSNLKAGLVDLLRISRDHEAYWQYRLDREQDIRRLWEDSMARVAQEQEELETRIGESEDKRKRTKRALKEALEGGAVGAAAGSVVAAAAASADDDRRSSALGKEVSPEAIRPVGRRPTIAQLTNNELSDDESEEDEEFFDAVDAGEVEVREDRPVISPTAAEATEASLVPVQRQDTNVRAQEIAKSFRGYEDGIRKKLKLDADNRPKVSLWGILKSMIGKDMTRMTLPVSFNEPTSLLYRVVEDMEYTDLLDIAADRQDSTERLVYVAGFAASEYASTIGRVAKPFNPLLGETYEYCRPDLGYRFFIEQVSHHPPVGAAYAESPKWDYYGESAVKSKFYGKSFEFNPLGTWFLNLRTPDGGSELYTWKKVTSSVVGIITGNPTVDNYGPMEVKNWTTGDVCYLDFKAKGWKANSAGQVTGKIVDAAGRTCWSVGGRWNDKIYARLTPGYEADVGAASDAGNKNPAILVWEAHPRPTGIPFNITPFVVTLNDLPDRLRPVLPPTDSRLRPDQRAMEEGEYDFAAVEKTRVEEGQRARRRMREERGEEFEPRWFRKEARHPVTGEPYWLFNHQYWKVRDEVADGKRTWREEGLEDVFCVEGGS
ncbi:Oxysterol-binding protein-domain-containing protein [Neohortaea acidophila]|uniref:Oxysterol-binding protein-domain-containing protein n=1 Tax=Neohortaea acidophila TaxID=245834 RepID=A0A6A6PLE0_9PEZI|nr:Oxysterol-binding protein-domain-containing protein [Neohortaea acidophila]KAF2480849.1 Oxysterol-binding protein-domain-containing protein [Neohortaea acidophila]